MIRYNELTGLSTYVFAKRQLNATQTQVLAKEFREYRKKQLDQHINLKKLAIRMEKNLKFVSVVGFKNKSHPEAFPVVQNLKNMGVRVSMLTGDDLHHAKMTANLLKIISIEEDIDHLHFTNNETGQIAIKEILEKFKKLTSVKKKPMGQKTLQHATTAVN